MTPSYPYSILIGLPIEVLLLLLERETAALREVRKQK
jgi:hypothetical protein